MRDLHDAGMGSMAFDVNNCFTVGATCQCERDILKHLLGTGIIRASLLMTTVPLIFDRRQVNSGQMASAVDRRRFSCTDRSHLCDLASLDRRFFFFGHGTFLHPKGRLTATRVPTGLDKAEFFKSTHLENELKMAAIMSTNKKPFAGMVPCVDERTKVEPVSGVVENFDSKIELNMRFNKTNKGAQSRISAGS